MNQFRCSNGQYIPASWRCDGYLQCNDQSDETNCNCTSNQFKCSNGQCIPASSQCDGYPQCLDGSDEISCSELIDPQR